MIALSGWLKEYLRMHLNSVKLIKALELQGYNLCKFVLIEKRQNHQIWGKKQWPISTQIARAQSLPQENEHEVKDFFSKMENITDENIPFVFIWYWIFISNQFLIYYIVNAINN